MAKLGFGGQWIAICRVGQHIDSKGTKQPIDSDFLKKVIANFNADNHEPPLVVGHPESDTAPAFGWTRELRLEGDLLEARFADTDDEFEKLVEQGRYKKRSASFYLEPPALRHVGFLGAQPPAVKGLREIQFNDGAKTAVEISFNEEKIMDKENENTADVKKTFGEWLKEVFGDKQSASPSANFSEAQAKSLISTAVSEVTEKLTTDFNEKLGAKDTKIKELTDKVNGITSSGKHAEIVSFVESIPAESGKHFLKRAGVVEFLEACADADAKDTDKAVVCFSETDGNREEVKFSRLEWAKELLSNLPTMISFGEGFANLKASAEADIQVNPAELSELRSAMGIKTAEGGAK